MQNKFFFIPHINDHENEYTYVVYNDKIEKKNVVCSTHSLEHARRIVALLNTAYQTMKDVDNEV